jgi:hypothetical protein
VVEDKRILRDHPKIADHCPPVASQEFFGEMQIALTYLSISRPVKNVDKTYISALVLYSNYLSGISTLSKPDVTFGYLQSGCSARS